ncbi:serpin B4-like isoform X8 [Aphis craccivora]|uniref:Serpin B4-like isoform X8 n=1 Tax=Aphis craccivora TaxID=307492 RepID=A0A6G0ZS43_APHCR|nr:serpin B4-like isoform X8 [Aphis craccivora]
MVLVKYSARYPLIPPKKVEFYADHPFVVAIVSRTDDVLFIGRLSNPGYCVFASSTAVLYWVINLRLPSSDFLLGMQFALMSAWIPEPAPKVDFYADHPFVIVILSRTDDVLFQGRLTKP